MKIFPHNEIDSADLIIDAIYEGGAKGHTGDDALYRVMPGVGNQGGFRAAGALHERTRQRLAGPP